MPRLDELIKKDIIDQMVRDDRVDASGINIDVLGGTVELKGQVPSYFMKKSGFQDTVGIPGVKDVRNRLQVVYPSSAFVPSDEQIENSIKIKLEASPDLDLRDMEVSVLVGSVTLKGTIDAYWKELYAEEIITNEPGIVMIDNHIAVVPSDDIIDKVIAESIIDSLEKRAEVDAEQVNVRVEDGEVSLTGIVPTWPAARQAAFESAVFIGGVIHVNNRVVVASEA